MNNVEIRVAILEANIKYYEIANKLGIHKVSFSRKLRNELSKEEKNRVLQAIEELKNSK